MPQGKTVAQLTALSSPTSDDLLLVYDNATNDSYKTTVTELRTALVSTTPIGSASAASYPFTGDPNTGLYSPGADQVSVTTGGTERIRFDSNGQIEANSLGTAAVPVFTFISDTDTGVYSPGANQIALGTNATGRVFVDASGNVGVATSTPTSRLHILGDTHLTNTGVTSTGTVINVTQTTVATTSATTISSVSASSARSARYQIQITQGTEYQAADLLAIHNGTTASFIEYGNISTGSTTLGSFNSTISSGNLILQVSMESSTSSTVKVVRTTIGV